jgi:hypothetical protein
LANAYLDHSASGAALALIERAPAAVRVHVLPRHALARALFEQGRATDALGVARELHQQCVQPAAECGSLLVSLTQRLHVLEELVAAGVEDANAHPEAAARAWQRATHTAVMAP